jgi:hypothetical protein
VKLILFALAIALLLVGCGEDPQKPGADSPESNQTSAEIPPEMLGDEIAIKTLEVAKVDLDDPKTLDRILAEAIYENKLRHRAKDNEKRLYPIIPRPAGYTSSSPPDVPPIEQTPYTGWSKSMWKNGQLFYLNQYKDGKKNGVCTTWHENGEKAEEQNYKDGQLDGPSIFWDENGTQKARNTFKDGKLVFFSGPPPKPPPKLLPLAPSSP